MWPNFCVFRLTPPSPTCSLKHGETRLPKKNTSCLTKETFLKTIELFWLKRKHFCKIKASYWAACVMSYEQLSGFFFWSPLSPSPHPSLRPLPSPCRSLPVPRRFSDACHGCAECGRRWLSTRPPTRPSTASGTIPSRSSTRTSSMSSRRPAWCPMIPSDSRRYALFLVPALLQMYLRAQILSQISDLVTMLRSFYNTLVKRSTSF